MEIINASKAKREFGEMLLKAQSAPVGINKNGKPVAVMLSVNEYQELNAIKEDRLKQLLQTGIDDLQSGKISDSKEVLYRLRNIVSKTKD